METGRTSSYARGRGSRAVTKPTAKPQAAKSTAPLTTLPQLTPAGQSLQWYQLPGKQVNRMFAIRQTPAYIQGNAQAFPPFMAEVTAANSKPYGSWSFNQVHRAYGDTPAEAIWSAYHASTDTKAAQQLRERVGWANAADVEAFLATGPSPKTFPSGTPSMYYETPLPPVVDKVWLRSVSDTDTEPDYAQQWHDDYNDEGSDGDDDDYDPYDRHDTYVAKHEVVSVVLPSKSLDDHHWIEEDYKPGYEQDVLPIWSSADNSPLQPGDHLYVVGQRQDDTSDIYSTTEQDLKVFGATKDQLVAQQIAEDIALNQAKLAGRHGEVDRVSVFSVMVDADAERLQPNDVVDGRGVVWEQYV